MKCAKTNLAQQFCLICWVFLCVFCGLNVSFCKCCFCLVVSIYIYNIMIFHNFCDVIFWQCMQLDVKLICKYKRVYKIVFLYYFVWIMICALFWVTLALYCLVRVRLGQLLDRIIFVTGILGSKHEGLMTEVYYAAESSRDRSRAIDGSWSLYYFYHG